VGAIALEYPSQTHSHTYINTQQQLASIQRNSAKEYTYTYKPIPSLHANTHIPTQQSKAMAFTGSNGASLVRVPYTQSSGYTQQTQPMPPLTGMVWYGMVWYGMV